MMPAKMKSTTTMYAIQYKVRPKDRFNVQVNPIDVTDEEM